MARLRLFSGGAAQGLVEALRPDFEAGTGVAIDGTFGAVGAMKAKLVAGEPADLVILTAALVRELTASGHLEAAGAADLGPVATAVAIRSGDPVPPVGDGEALRATLLAADALYIPDPQTATAGIHVAAVLDRLGIAAAMAGRLRAFPNGATAMRELARAPEARPLGATQTTEILSTPGVALVAPLPPGCDLSTVYRAAPTVSTEHGEAVRRLIRLLSGETAAAERRRAGFGET